MAAASGLEQVTALVAQLVGLAILAGTLAAVAAFVYRWYARDVIPRGLSLLVGLSGIAVYLNTTTALGQVIGGSSAPTGVEEALFNITAFAVGAGGAVLGRRVGDRFGTDVVTGRRIGEIEDDVGQFVRSVGRVIAVELPEEIDDVVGYDPVPEQTKAELAGKRFLFPRRLTVEELRDRLVARLKADYAVGHVDVELTDNGTVEYLALGSRAAGIGPTLPPATNAVAIRADPAFAASAGDLVQVWETDPMRRVLTAELRGVAEDTVTIAIDAADTPKIDPRVEYRLVTLPVTDRPDREFASLLRAADETFSSVTVDPGSPAHGMPVGALDLTVVSVKPESEDPVVLPAPEYVLAPGDVVFAIARPEALRRLEEAARPLDPSLVRNVGRPSRPPGDDQSRQPDQTARTAADSPSRQTADTSPGEAREGLRDKPEPAVDQEPETADTTPAESQDVESTRTESEDDGPPQAPPANAEGADAEDDASDEDDEPADRADTQSFQELKDEFESGEADWAGDADSTGTEPADSAESTPATEEDAPDSESGFEADPSDLSVEDEDESKGETEANADEGSFDFGDDLDDSDGIFDEGEGDGLDGLELEGGDEGEDDSLDGLQLEGGDEGEDDSLAALDFDDETDDSGFDLDEDEEDDEGEDESETDGDGEEEGDDDEDKEEDGEEDTDDDDQDDENGDTDDDDDGDGNGSGGTSSFQQLKEEFESGDADWADDVSDSPGGDMRLDE